jgi:hypothetical protein
MLLRFLNSIFDNYSVSGGLRKRGEEERSHYLKTLKYGWSLFQVLRSAKANGITPPCNAVYHHLILAGIAIDRGYLLGLMFGECTL